MIVLLYKGKAERTECKKGWKYVCGILVDRFCRVTESLIDDEQGGFRVGSGCVDQGFTLKHIGEKAQEKKCRVYVMYI